MKIKSPVTDYTGTDTYGGTVLKFEDGVADFDGDLPAGVRLYLEGAGYGIGSKSPAGPEELPEVPDPRDATIEQVGTPLRDAAVDPRDGDFLAPTNAGKPGPEGNPHGPHVVAPEIHGSQGVRPVKGGEVHVDDADEQDAAETEHTEASTDGGPVPGSAEEAAELKGAALDEALEEAGLPKSGTADEKRARLAEHRGA